MWRLVSPPVEDVIPDLPTILRLGAQRASALLLVFSPAVEFVAVAAGISDPLRALIIGGATELCLLAAFVLARARFGLRRPELTLFLLASVMIVSMLFASLHLRTEVNVYAVLPAVVPLALAAFAPLPPSLLLLLGVEVALVHPLALVLAPMRWALDPWICAALALSLSAMAASAARSQRALWSALTRARERALDATRLKSEFLANMSHEIRTPMTAILGFADELELALPNGGAEDPARQALVTIQRNGEHLLSLINGILDLSKIEAGKLAVTRTRFSPIALVADVVSLLGPRAREKGLALDARCDGPVPETIQSDAMWLRQIVINLVGNAIKFTSAGEVRVIMRLAALDAPSGHLLEIVVEDTGLGLDVEQQQIVFEPFTQVQGAATREFTGTGLGLSLSRRLARLLGGDIHVESSPGRGSRFAARVATGPLEGVRMSAPGDAPGIVPSGNFLGAEPRVLHGRVLLAEDGADNQRLLRGILERVGLEVEVVANGELAAQRALAAFELGEPFDLVLMDMQMPVLDGYQATERLRESGYPGPIVALTAHAMSGDREKCLQAGCDDYATKPVARADLLARIEAQLAKGRVRDR